MSLADLVNIQISSTVVNPTTPGFGVPLIAAYHTAWTDRLRYYSSTAAMLTDGFTVNSPAYKAAVVLMSQSPSVTQFAIGRRSNVPHQTLTLTCTDATQGDVYKFTLIGSDGSSHPITYTVPGAATTTTVATAILALINAIPSVATIIGTATSSVAVITISRTDGLLTDITGWMAGVAASPSTQLQLADTTADPGLAADLAAIYAVDSTGWYGLALDSNSAAEIEAAAAWTEATGTGGKLFAANNSDYGNVNNAVSNDVFSTLKGLSYAKTYVQQCNKQLLNYAGAAMLGNRLPDNPGSDNWAYKTLKGVPADDPSTMTQTFQNVLKAKNGNWFMTVAGLNISFPGQSPEGQFMDIARFLDWLQAFMQIDVFTYLASQKKVPFTDVGIDAVVNVIKNRLKIGGSPAFGGLDLTRGYTVTAPTRAQVSTTDANNRNLSGTTFKAFLAGAINTVQSVNGTVST